MDAMTSLAYLTTAQLRSGVTTISESKYRPDIEGLRAVAVLAVVLYHLGLPLIHGGFVGVDIFFVISGFLITRRIAEGLESGSFSFREFYLARVRRIFPAMMVTTLLSLVAASIVMSPGALQDLAGSAIAAIASVSNIYFWLDSGYFTADSSVKALLHTWSLGVEEQFYLLWPLVLAATFAFRRNALPIVIGVISIISLIAAELVMGEAPSTAFFLMPFRVCEFGLGAIMVWLVRNWRPSPLVSEGAVALGLALMLTAVLLFDSSMRFPGITAVVPGIGAALVILLGAQSRLARVMLASPVAVGIGKISYSLYLVHWPLVVFSEYALSRDLRPIEAGVALIACLGLAAAMYVWVEQPVRKQQDGRFLVRPAMLLLTVGSLAAVAVVPALNASYTGWTWRLGDRASALAGISNPRDFHVSYFGGAKCGLPRCETNPAAERVAYLIGDSHARAYYAGLKVAFPDVNFVIYGPNSCPMYTATMSQFDVYTDACLAARKLAFEEIARTPGPVFMAHHWAARMASPHRVNASDVPLEFGEDIGRFAAFVLEQVDDVERLIGTPVFLVGGVPRYGGQSSPFDCASRPIPPGDCGKSPNSGYVAVQEAITVAFQSNGAQAIDPYDVLCDELSCRDADDQRRSMYSDRTHLSIWGSEYLVKGLRPALLQLLDSHTQRPSH